MSSDKAEEDENLSSVEDERSKQDTNSQELYEDQNPKVKSEVLSQMSPPEPNLASITKQPESSFIQLKDTIKDRVKKAVHSINRFPPPPSKSNLSPRARQGSLSVADAEAEVRK